jgi:YebC/PmpR family DNA-binding regulatory protein
MSGHSKWASIKHKKGAEDAKRGKLFSKLNKEITIAARLGGGDPEANPRLRAAILKGKSANMPKDNIDRAVKKGSGELEGVDYTEIVYEAYGPGGVAILISCLTDNKNRTAADIRNLLTKNGGNLGESGCVSYLFNRKGIIAFDAAKYTEDDIIGAALDAGAEDVTNDGETIEVVTEPEQFETVLNAFDKLEYENTMAEIAQIPDATLELEPGKTRKSLRLIEKIDDHDDVQEVATNLEIPEGFSLEDDG